MQIKTFGLGSALVLALSWGCSESTCEEDKNCNPATGGNAGAGGAGATGGVSGTGGTVGGGGVSGTGASGTGGTSGTDGGGCDTSKAPSEEACLVADEHAVFVNGTAASTGNGTKASPFKTITEALAAVSGKVILVCDTTYGEQVKITAGVKLFGGFSCADWSYEPGKRALVKPVAKGAALAIESVSATVVIEDVEFEAQNGVATGESSVAASVTSSTDVKLHRVRLAAGTGAPGTNGQLAAYTYPAQASLDGNNANGIAGGAPKQCSCPAGDQSIGGAGGNAPPATKGNDGFPALGGGKGGSPGTCLGVGTGQDGAAAPAAPPAPGATTLGTLVSSNWTPSKGASGAPGGVGQGGGGGASSATGGGGGGGCGGCGGAGGPGGGSGGASIALIAIDSTVALDAGSELSTQDAGSGGSGAAGQTGQADIGGGGLPGSLACMGGAGAPGAPGGAGGGGAGGISVAVLYKGIPPAVDSATKVVLGQKGAKGAGGKPGTNDGIEGVSQKVLEVK